MSPVKPGWRGRFFEDFEVGDVYEHPLGRTVLPVDNSWFTLLTQNTELTQTVSTLVEQIDAMTREVHARVAPAASG